MAATQSRAGLPAVNVLVCVKRVPMTGGKIALTDDLQAVDTRMAGFTVSPHEECAVEEAVRIVEARGGAATVLTLGPPEAAEQLRDAMALGIGHAVLLETDGRDWDPVATAEAIVEAVRGVGSAFDLLLFGNEAADTGDYQVGVRVAYALDLPCVTGVKAITIRDGRLSVRREAAGGWETLETSLPAVVTVKEGLNLPRYPSLPGRLKGKKREIARLRPSWRGAGLSKLRLGLPAQARHAVELLGRGREAAPRVVDLLQELGLVERRP
jgi:electron transfer flavoprotein beta subunit